MSKNPNWNRKFWGQKPEGTCRHCGELIWANSDAKVACLAGECNPSLSKDASAREMLAIFDANLAAGLISREAYEVATAAVRAIL